MTRTLLAVVLLFLVPAAAASVSSTLTLDPGAVTAGQAVQVTFTKTVTLATDGIQNGTATLHIHGPVNVTLAAIPYRLVVTNPLYLASAALAWTWTPTLAGNYTLTVTDQATQGAARNQTQTIHVEGAGSGGGGGGTVMVRGPVWPGFFLGILAAGFLVLAVWHPRHEAARTRYARLILATAVLASALAIFQPWRLLA